MTDAAGPLAALQSGLIVCGARAPGGVDWRLRWYGGALVVDIALVDHDPLWITVDLDDIVDVRDNSGSIDGGSRMSLRRGPVVTCAAPAADLHAALALVGVAVART